MANISLPTRQNLPIYSYTIDLDGTTYTLRYRYNSRMEKWFLDFRTETGESIVEGIPIVADWPIFDRFQDDRLPPGILFAFDTSGQAEDPGRYDLGNRVQMIYQEESGGSQ